MIHSTIRFSTLSAKWELRFTVLYQECSVSIKTGGGGLIAPLPDPTAATFAYLAMLGGLSAQLLLPKFN